MSVNGRPKKQRPLRGKGGLVGVAVLVIIGIWLFLDLRNPVREPGENPHLADLVGLKPEQVTGLEVKDGGKTLFAVTKAREEWRVEQPFQGRADKGKIENLLKGLLDAAINGELPTSEQDPARYGLDKPQVELLLRVGSRQKVIRTGKPGPMGTDLYAQITGYRRFVVIAQSQVNEFKNQKPEDLRDKQILAVDRDSARRIALRTQAGETVLEKKGQDEWELTSPFRAKAGKYEATGLIENLTPLRAQRFVADNPPSLTQYGLDQPALTVTVTDKNGTHTLLFGRQAPAPQGKKTNGAPERGYYCVRSGDATVFLVDGLDYDGLNKDTSQLRDRTLLTFEESRAERMTITNSSGEIELQKRGDEWWLVRPENVKANRDRVVGILSSLRGDASRHVEENPADLNRYGLASPAIRVSVWTSGGQTQQLSLGAKVPGKDLAYYAQTSEAKAVFQVQEFVKRDLDVKPEELKAEELKKTAAPPAGPANPSAKSPGKPAQPPSARR
ncbi:MAG: DUF4340 domain-containing protein [Armatimonadetes bacterium]|nr:DUF4340 domain-containing protein [Armatimonadota bacterium]